MRHPAPAFAKRILTKVFHVASVPTQVAIVAKNPLSKI